LSGRTIPPIATQVPGNFVTSALWNTQINNGLYSFAFNPPYFKGQATSTQSIATGSSFTTVTLTTSVTDTEGGWVSGSPTIYTVQTPGRYLIIATVGIPGTSGTDVTPRGISLSVNGSAVRVVRTASGGTDWNGQVSHTTFLTAGNTVSFSVMQQSGSAQNTDVAASTYPTLELIWLGAN
jgi:hypothetical protein